VTTKLALISILPVVFLLPVLLKASPPQTGMAGTGMVPISRVELATLNDDEFKKIQSYEGEIKRLAALYNFHMEDTVYWPTLLQCPAWTKNVVLEFESVEIPGQVPSTFIVVSSTGTLHLIPLFYHGMAPIKSDTALDPHNIATFNRIIDDEPPNLRADSIWLQEAVCYLGIVVGSPKLVLPENIRELIRPSSDQVIQRVSPVVKTSEKEVEVLLYEVIADERDIVEWTLSFDRKGFLRDVHRERKRRSAVLNSRTRN
jgi:hypothetical protein